MVCRFTNLQDTQTTSKLTSSSIEIIVKNIDDTKVLLPDSIPNLTWPHPVHLSQVSNLSFHINTQDRTLIGRSRFRPFSFFFQAQWDHFSDLFWQRSYFKYIIWTLSLLCIVHHNHSINNTMILTTIQKDIADEKEKKKGQEYIYLSDHLFRP